MKACQMRDRLAAPLARRLATKLSAEIAAEIAEDSAELDAAARDVVDAVNQLQQVRHTRAELAARHLLERRALALRAVVRKRDERI